MTVTIEKKVTYRAMCDTCRSLSRWWNTLDEAVDELAGHRCEQIR